MQKLLLLTICASAAYAQALPQGPLGAPSAPAAGSTIKPDTVVAVIAGVSVTAGDVGKIMQFAPPNLVQQFKQNPQLALSVAFQMQYLTDEAEKMHLDQQEPTKGTLEAMLKWQKENILANAMVNQLNNGYQVTEDQINEFYKSHESRYEEAKIKIILIGYKPSGLSTDAKSGESVDDKLKREAEQAVKNEHVLNNRSEAEARTLADDLVKQLRGGADFAALVAKYSDDKESKDAGGDFGVPIKATSSFAPEIKKVVFDLKKGEISEPLQQVNSFYIIRLEDKTVQPLKDVLESIVKELRDQHMSSTLKDLNDRFAPQVLRPDFFIQAQKQANGN